MILGGLRPSSLPFANAGNKSTKAKRFFIGRLFIGHNVRLAVNQNGKGFYLKLLMKMFITVAAILMPVKAEKIKERKRHKS